MIPVGERAEHRVHSDYVGEIREDEKGEKRRALVPPAPRDHPPAGDQEEQDTDAVHQEERVPHLRSVDGAQHEAERQRVARPARPVTPASLRRDLGEEGAPGERIAEPRHSRHTRDGYRHGACDGKP